MDFLGDEGDQSMEHQAGKGDDMQARHRLGQPFVIPGQAAEATRPGEIALDHPAAGQHHEALPGLAQRDNHQVEPMRRRCLGSQLAGRTLIDEGHLDVIVRGRPSGCDARRALLRLGSHHRYPRRRLDGGPLAAAPGHHAQKKTVIAREQDAATRAAWRVDMATIDAERLIFLDETSTPTTLTPLRGRSPRGQWVVRRVPRGR